MLYFKKINQRTLFTFSFLCCFSFPGKILAETKTAEIVFFNKKISVFYDNTIVVDIPYKPAQEGYFEFYHQRTDTTKYEILLKSLQSAKYNLRLNDWLYFQLIKKSVDEIFSLQKEYQRNLFLWFLLNKTGYETRLEFKGKDITLSVFSYDLVYGVPQSKGRGGYYIDITSFGNQIDYEKWTPFRVEFNPNKKTEAVPFSFTLKELPTLFENKIVEKEFSFTHGGKEFKINIPLHSGYVEFLSEYPELSVLKHTEFVLSTDAYNTLIPFLREQTSGMDSVQTIRFLMSFCRTGFNFKKDEIAFAETPYFRGAAIRIIFAPEETLFSKYVDSEDISVLFYFLAREVINPEMVLLKYGKQVSVAVYLHQKIGMPIMYNNKPYALCDVSENDDTVEIGHAPKSLAGKYPSFIEK